MSVPLDDLPPDPLPIAPSDHARAQARTAADIARLLAAESIPPRRQRAALDLLVRSTTEVAEYFGLDMDGT